MTIQYKVREQVMLEQEKQQIWDVLCECSHEFIPPLTGRTSSTQSQLNNAKETNDKPYAYFEKMIQQSYVIAIDEDTDRLVGFMTFIPNYISDELKDYNPSNYISTVCVTKAYRNQGITRGFYDIMLHQLDKQAFPNNYISTRTWSTNDAHLHVLEKLGFSTVLTLADHRGKGIDTVYLAAKK